MKNKYSVGQKLWLQHIFSNSRSRYVEIARVGRKWLYAGVGANILRIDKKTLDVDSEQYYCYESREAWQEFRFKTDAWRRLRDNIWYYSSPPPLLTLEDIQSFHNKLRGEDA